MKKEKDIQATTWYSHYYPCLWCFRTKENPNINQTGILTRCNEAYKIIMGLKSILVSQINNTYTKPLFPSVLKRNCPIK